MRKRSFGLAGLLLVLATLSRQRPDCTQGHLKSRSSKAVNLGCTPGENPPILREYRFTSHPHTKLCRSALRKTRTRTVGFAEKAQLKVHDSTMIDLNRTSKEQPDFDSREQRRATWIRIQLGA